MPAIYCVSIFLFIYYFTIGYKRFVQTTFKSNKLGVIGGTFLLYLFYFIQVNHNLQTMTSLLLNFAGGYIVYKLAKKYYDEPKSIMCVSLYLLNPVIVIFSSGWNRNLSAWTLLILFIIYCISEKNILLACICFSISGYYYIETLYLLPVFLLAVLNEAKEKEGFKPIASLMGAVIVPCALLIMSEKVLGQMTPFKERLRELIVPERIAYNACNLWSLMGFNWKAYPQDRNGVVLTVTMMVSLIGIALVLYHSWKQHQLKYLQIALISIMALFLFGIGMHEHILIIVILLALVYFLYSGQLKAYGVYFGLSVLSFLNQIYTCSVYNPSNFHSNDRLVMVTSFLLIVLFVTTIVWFQRDKNLSTHIEEKAKESNLKDREKALQEPLINESGQAKIGKKDYVIMLVLMAVFTALSLPSLGSHEMPVTTYKVTKDSNKEIILDLGEEKKVDHLSVFLGYQSKRNVTISTYDEASEEWQKIGENQDIKSVFAWNNIEIKAKTRYLGIVCADEEAYFNEFAIVGENGELIKPVNFEEYKELFDEQSLYKAYPNYYDQTFFDEVYHARTAYEYIQHYISYENTHPPLGKIMIGIGIRIFGLNPFGWRIVGELIGILMIPLMYIFAKKLFKNDFAAAGATLLLTMDFMHFTLSKIATLDIIIGFFILLMYYFMYGYITLDFMKTPLKKSFIPLGLCGITMGIGVAVKWTGAYAGAGLAVLFFTYLWQSYSHFEGDKKVFIKKLVYTLLFCMVFFVAIPATIYCLSYIPFIGYRPYNGILDKVFDNMQTMYNYHSNLKGTHPYESWWYEWPWMKRPLYQAVTHGTNGKGSAISCFGNPLVWWPGFLAVLYLFKCWLWDKDKKAGFLCISYSAQLIPWMFVTRNTFIYHYFPCSLFTILCSGYCIKKIVEKYVWGKKAFFCYMGIVIICFALFYPVISGQWIDENWVRTWLRWLKGWVLI